MGNYLNGLIVAALSLASISAYAETLVCGEKEITLKAGQIVKMKHEDGTIHTKNISRNWAYDGKSITHFLAKKPIPCSKPGKPKSRRDTIAQSASRFTKNPSSFAMSAEEARQMERYTTKLMEADNACHLLVDAAKSSTKEGMFYVDCNNQSSQNKRYWISASELKNGRLGSDPKPISSKAATEHCIASIKSKTTNPSTFNADTLAVSSDTFLERGRNVVEINFEAANAFGEKGEYRGRCVLENGSLIDVTTTRL